MPTWDDEGMHPGNREGVPEGVRKVVAEKEPVFWGATKDAVTHRFLPVVSENAVQIDDVVLSGFHC